MNALSLFSGIGGIDLACEWAGIQTVAFCEREPFCQKVLRKHWPDVPIYDDVCTLTREVLERDGIGPIDLIHGGYPCQPFSYAGKRKGTEDDRHLWPEYFKLVQEIQPSWVVGENVAGHISLGLDDVLADLESVGYTVQAFVIPACAVGSGHRRDRVFVVGYTEHIGSSWATIRRGVDPAGNDIEEGADETGEPAGASGRAHHQDVADTDNERRQQRDVTAGSEGLGHHSRSVDAGGIHERRWPTKSRMGRGFDELSDWLDGGMNPLDALSDFVAKYPQPALMGQPQYDWEPPRVATGIKDRAARLKALGNAVDPLQIFPIMAAIKMIDEWVMSQ